MHRARALAPALALATGVLVGCGSGELDKDQTPPIAPGEDSALPDDTGSSDDTGDANPPPVDYSATGPYSAGAIAFDAIVSSGTTPALVWYPTTETGSTIEYAPSIPSVAVEDATPDCSTVRPVVLHSHGNGSANFEMSWMAEHLASHGVITVALDHVGNTFYETTGDFVSLYEQRPTDIAELYDLLVGTLSAAGGPLDGCVDPEAGYIVSGYSFGGYTAYAVAGAKVNTFSAEAVLDFSDSRARAVIAYAPWDGGGALSTGMAEIEVPALTVGAARDGTVFRQYEALHGAISSTPRILGVFPDAGHYTFVSMCNIYVFYDGCGESWVDLEDFKDRTGTAAAAFVGHLAGDADGLDAIQSEPEIVTWTVVPE